MVLPLARYVDDALKVFFLSHLLWVNCWQSCFQCIDISSAFLDMIDTALLVCRYGIVSCANGIVCTLVLCGFDKALSGDPQRSPSIIIIFGARP